jgi:hypothetical protein
MTSRCTPSSFWKACFVNSVSDPHQRHGVSAAASLRTFRRECRASPLPPAILWLAWSSKIYSASRTRKLRSCLHYCLGPLQPLNNGFGTFWKRLNLWMDDAQLLCCVSAFVQPIHRIIADFLTYLIEQSVSHLVPLCATVQRPLAVRPHQDLLALLPPTCLSSLPQPSAREQTRNSDYFSSAPRHFPRFCIHLRGTLNSGAGC